MLHENQDVWIQFMKRNGLFLYWFEDDNRNQCWVPLQHIIYNVEVPIPHGSSSRKYTLSRNDFDNIKKLLLEKIVFDWSYFHCQNFTILYNDKKHLQTLFVSLCFSLLSPENEGCVNLKLLSQEWFPIWSRSY